MGKMLQLLALTGVVFLIVGTAFLPQNPAFWLASHSMVYQLIRIVIAFFLMIQLSTRPPRYIWFRIFAGAIALAVGGWSIEASYLYHMLFFDTLCFLSAAIAIGTTSLERQPHTADLLSSHKKALA